MGSAPWNTRRHEAKESKRKQKKAKESKAPQSATNSFSRLTRWPRVSGTG
jgi:hypothetical protein